VGDLRNPSDPSSQGFKSLLSHFTLTLPHSPHKLDFFPSSSSPVIRLRYQIVPSRILDFPDNEMPPSWECLLWNGRLYVATAAEHLPAADGIFYSKEAFLAMLNHAKETFGCSKFILCLDGNVDDLDEEKDRIKKKSDLRNVVRLFLFLGFEPLAQGHEFLPTSNKDLVCFVDSI